MYYCPVLLDLDVWSGKPCSRVLLVTFFLICGVGWYSYSDVFVPLSTVDSRRFSGPFVVVKVSQNSMVGKQMLLYFMLAAENIAFHFVFSYRKLTHCRKVYCFQSNLCWGSTIRVTFPLNFGFRDHKKLMKKQRLSQLEVVRWLMNLLEYLTRWIYLEDPKKRWCL